MSLPSFDAAGFARFNLEKGTISSPVEDRLALVPTGLLAAIESTEQIADAARRWGAGRGELLSWTLEGEETEAGMEILANHLAGAVATAGLGKSTVQVRQDALLVRMENTIATSSPGAVTMIESFIGGYLGALDENTPFQAVMLEDGLFFCGNPTAVEKVRRAIQNGTAPFAALDALSEKERSR